MSDIPLLNTTTDDALAQIIASAHHVDSVTRTGHGSLRHVVAGGLAWPWFRRALALNYRLAGEAMVDPPPVHAATIDERAGAQVSVFTVVAAAPERLLALRKEDTVLAFTASTPPAGSRERTFGLTTFVHFASPRDRREFRLIWPLHRLTARGLIGAGVRAAAAPRA